MLCFPLWLSILASPILAVGISLSEASVAHETAQVGALQLRAGHGRGDASPSLDREARLHAAQMLAADTSANTSAYTNTSDNRPTSEMRHEAVQEMELFTRDIAKRWQLAFVESFYVVSIAELFDKTWFVAMLLGLAYTVRSAFWASVVAQSIHTCIAASFGMGISTIIPVSTLHFMVSGIFGLMTIFYANEWYEADPFADSSLEDAKAKKKEKEDAELNHGLLDAAFVSCFVIVFMAEWGDRTQVALIALTTSLPVIPVCLGGLCAKFLLTGSALLMPSILDKRRFSDTFMNGVTALSFACFTALALLAGVKARNEALDGVPGV
jgi:putative Ca2+/H+ antiporter (TMEM165/GDT1 family)